MTKKYQEKGEKIVTIEEINRYMKRVPGFARDLYGLHELPDLSKEPCESVAYEGETYKYYPGIPGVVIGSKLVLWEVEMHDVCKVDVHNPEHFAEILRRGRRLQYDDALIGIMELRQPHGINVRLSYEKYLERVHSKSIPIDGTKIYYNPDDIDLEKNGPWRMTAIGIFLARRYYREYIIPYRYDKPEDWGLYD